MQNQQISLNPIIEYVYSDHQKSMWLAHSNHNKDIQIKTSNQQKQQEHAINPTNNN